ncbi:hypothetical protein SD77_0232 [Bacillus badius]|uniref:Mobile element protein n=1 Tax=Bacillus badius TaxID=1455 RepID=A0ABR5B081_BACBA|nr:hypothetical protein SD78_3561 [Bacillus badius]KIL80384.1 hypothetical protein SD77_0232 [Bacillus badius]
MEQSFQPDYARTRSLTERQEAAKLSLILNHILYLFLEIAS